MKNKKYTFLVFITLLVLFIWSCVKEDLGNIESNLVITPSYSVPIGKSSFVMEDVVGSPGFDTIAVDTIFAQDSSFSYEDRWFEIPPGAYYDTTFTEYNDFSTMEEWIENATYLMFRLNMENAIPAGVNLQVSLLDANENIILSMFEGNGFMVQAGTPEASFVLNAYDTDPVEGDEILALPNARYIKVYVGMDINSLSSGVKYYSDQFFKLQMGVRIGLKRDLGE